MPRLVFACYIFATSLLAGYSLRAGPYQGLRAELKRRSGEDIFSFSEEYQLLMDDVEAAYGGALTLNFWGIQDGLCGTCVSSQDQDNIMQKNNESEWSAGIYGEIRPDSVVRILQKLGARRGQRFYDLGSGAGKTIAIAAHFFGMNATGIELSGDRHDVGCQALRKLQETPPPAQAKESEARHAELVQGSFFDYDFSDADLIFTNSMRFTNDMMRHIANMGRSLKKGTRIATSQELPGTEYTKVEKLDFPASWGRVNVTVYEKTSPARAPLSLPAPPAAPRRCSASWAGPELAS